ncbi:hypothetical protein [Paucisalibacillus sp. EB02]|uniref:hypothetical protein n=1 Tax=Paucisalibacillus sp. EB02 TaxID=1347087 RepID=UPI0004B2627F|nr:hypothetical protein [Paucisalibacillus sp. EB02]
MLKKINEEIVQIKGELHRKKKLELQLNDFQHERYEMEQTITKLKNQLTNEKRDVKKLEGLSITNIFSTISGTKYEKLDKEKREVMAVQLQLEEAEKTISEISASIMEVRKKLSEINLSELEYQELLKKKEQYIKESNSQYANQLYAISDQEGDVLAYVKELREAVTAGRYAKDALENAEKSLESAESWGTWDMFGGGMLSTAMKHSSMDDASNYIHIAQTRMREFQKELLDIGEMIEVDMDVSELLRFADFFFDGFIVDWMVQGRIQDSQGQVWDQLAKVEKIMDTLEEELVNREEKLIELQIERKLLIENI